MKNAPWIVAVGARSSIGLTALQVSTSFRADLFEPRACELLDSKNHKIGICRVGGLGRELYGYDRLMKLAVPALRETLSGHTRAGAPLPLVVAAPSSERPDDEERMLSFASDLAHQLGHGLDASRAELVRKGHSGGVEALRRAGELLDEGAESVVVGGVDSFYHPEVLQWLDSSYRLHGPGTDDGFIPGEAAAFALLCRKPQGARARLLSAEVRDEPGMLDEDKPLIAEALTSLFAQADGTGAPWVINDMNNEHQRKREWRFVQFRHDLGASEVHFLPAGVGDVGAASAPLMLAIACSWWALGCAPASRVLFSTSSDGAQRGLAAVEEVTS